jgi:hypothetical protein
MLFAGRLLLWVLLVLMPLQGFAAASMLCCTLQATHEMTMAIPDGEAAGATDTLPAVRAYSDSHPVAALTPVSQRRHDVDHERHGCGLCTSLCHAIALSGAAAALKASPPSHQVPGQVQPPVATRPFPVADKPPRA